MKVVAHEKQTSTDVSYDNVKMVLADEQYAHIYVWQNGNKYPVTLNGEKYRFLTIFPGIKTDALSIDVEKTPVESIETVDISTEEGSVNLSAEFVNEYAKPETEDTKDIIDESSNDSNSQMVNIEENMLYSKQYAVPIDFDERMNKETPWLDLLIATMRRVSGQNNFIMNFVRNINEELDVLDIKYEVDTFYKGCMCCKSITLLVSDFNTMMPCTLVFKLRSKGFNEGVLTVYMKDKKTLEQYEPTILKYIQDIIRWHDDFREKDCAGILDEELLKLDSDIRAEEHDYYLTHDIPKELLVYNY